MNEMTLVGQPDQAFLETGSLVGCILHGPSRTLVRQSTLSAHVAGWGAFDEPVPSPVAEACWLSRPFHIAGATLSLCWRVRNQPRIS